MTTTTNQRQTIAASLAAIRELAPDTEPTVAVMHLGHPSDAKYGTVEYMTLEEYRKFVLANTWPRPKEVKG